MWSRQIVSLKLPKNRGKKVVESPGKLTRKDSETRLAKGLSLRKIDSVSPETVPKCYRTVCRIGLIAWRQDTNWCNRSFPTHCHLDGELFLFRVANPKGDVPSNLGF